MMTSNHAPRYVPVGMPTRRNSPNLNMTTNQHRRLTEKARSVILMGTNIDKEIAKQVSLLAPSRFRAAVATKNQNSQFAIVWDSGASICVTPNKKDFVKYNTSTDIKIVK